MSMLLRTPLIASPEKSARPTSSEGVAVTSARVDLDEPRPVRTETELPSPEAEESLVVDRRAVLRPAQMVEQKLVSLLRGKGLPVSHIQMVRSLRNR